MLPTSHLLAFALISYALIGVALGIGALVERSAAVFTFLKLAGWPSLAARTDGPFPTLTRQRSSSSRTGSRKRRQAPAWPLKCLPDISCRCG